MYDDSSVLRHVVRRFERPEDAVDARIDRLGENEDPMPLVLETLSRIDLNERLPLLKKLFEEKGADIHYMHEGRTLLLFAIAYLNLVGPDSASCLEYLLQRGADRTDFDVGYARQLDKQWAVQILERFITPTFRQHIRT